MITPEVRISSQPEALQSRMRQAKMTRGEAVRADIFGISVWAPSGILDGREVPRPTVFFCHMGRLGVVQELEPGDGGELPTEAEVVDLHFPEFGVFDILGAVVSSNGCLCIRADSDTQVVPHQRTEETPEVVEIEIGAEDTMEEILVLVGI